jgi:hypothetical protein
MYTLDDYFRSQQIPLQWSPILRSLATELVIGSEADIDALRQLFLKIGIRFARDVEVQFEGVQTLTELTTALNDFWSKTHWGWVALTETKEGIEIEHRYAPLAEAFGDEMLEWTVGILEGFYQTVFRSFGASERLIARLVSQQEDGLYMHIRLAA